MAVNMKQSMNLSQNLRMTPQLQQAIKLLQLSRMELESTVRKELEENPVLEENMEAREERPEALSTDKQDSIQDNSQDQDPTKQDEFDWDSYIENQNRGPTAPSSGGGNEEIMNYENVISATTSLYDHLMWQIKLYGFNEEEEEAASF